MLTPSVQDYLKAVFEMGEAGRPATTGSLAARLGVAPASVTAMLARLARPEPGLLRYTPRKGAALTEAGRRAALEVVRTHRLLERFLVEVLGFGWDEVHDEAERLEHAVSPRFLERLDAVLGHPDRDPHGDPIPDAAGRVAAPGGRPLGDLPVGAAARVWRVSREEREFLRHLGALGLVPGARVEVLERDGAGRTRLRTAAGEAFVEAVQAADVLVEPPAGGRA